MFNAKSLLLCVLFLWLVFSGVLLLVCCVFLFGLVWVFAVLVTRLFAVLLIGGIVSFCFALLCVFCVYLFVCWCCLFSPTGVYLRGVLAESQRG